MPRTIPLLFSASLLSIVAVGCDIAADNPFDPEAPAEVQAEATLSGVISGQGGALEGATVTLGDVELTTGEDGAYDQTLTPGEFTVVVTHPAHLQFAVTVTLAPGEDRTLDATLDPIPQVENEEAGRIFGVVQRAGQLGLPAAEQDHSAIVVEVDGTGVRAATGIDGAFDLFLAPGTYDLTVSTAGHDSATRTGIIVVAGEAVEAPESPIVLSGIPGSVTGTALLEDGAAADGIAIDLVGGGSATTNVDGVFSVGDVPAGSYLLTATKDGYEPFTFGFVNVEAGRETTLPGFVLRVSRGVIFGRAQLAGQADSSGIGIQLAGAANSAVTGVDGAFRLEGVREGTYTLSAFKDGFVTVNVDGIVVVANDESDVGDVTLAPQQGDFSINGGAIFTTDPVVTLELEGEGAVEMRISEDQNFADAGQGDTAFRAFAATPSFTLSSGDGLKTLFAQLKDGDGVEGPLLTAQITLDTTAPVVDDLVINGGAQFTRLLAVTLGLQASDATSGVAAMQLSQDAVLDEPFESFAANPNFNFDALTVDGDTDVHVRVRDFAGNISAEVVATITLDRVAPTLTAFSVDCAGQTDPLFCPNAIVSLHVESPDAVAMAVSNTAGLPNAIFQPIQTDSAHLLSPGDGAREVFLLLRDAAGNVSLEFSDGVTVDSVAPLFPSVNIAGGAVAVNTQTVTVDLAATGATFMRVAFDGVIDTEPTVAFAPQATGDLPPNDEEKTVLAVFLDDAGNLSAIASDTVLLDRIAPTIDSFAIDGGAAFTNDAGGAVTLTVTASDTTSGVVNLQVDNDAVFDGPLEAFVGTRAHVLGNVGSDGAKTVRVRVRDAAGNFSNEASAVIELDTAVPTLDAPFTIDCDGVTDAALCTSSVVSLSVSSTNAVEMAVSNIAGLPDASFEPIATGVAHLLAGGDGARTAFLLLRDAAGNVSAEFSDTITVDTAAPTLGNVVIEGGAAAINDPAVTLTISATGATKMRVSFDGALDTEPLIDFDVTASGTLPGVDGLKTVIVVFEDDAGNASAAATDSVLLDTLPPQAPSLVIAADAAFTTSTTVTLALNATGATEMRIRTDGAFDAEPFVPFAASAAVLLLPGDCPSTQVGCKEACVIFRDAAGNESAEDCDTITLDSTPPAIPVITTLAQVVANTAFAFNIAGEPADEFFAGYEVVVDPGSNGVFAPAAPAGVTFNVTLTGPTVVDPALASTDNLLRLRAIDQAGNKSGEATLAVTVDPIAPAVPVPSVTAATVNADTFAVFFDAVNSSQEDATFDGYEIATNGGGFTPTALQDGLIFTLTQGDGVGCVVGTPQTPCVNTLRVRAVDAAGNTSAAVDVVVDEDSTVPTAPRLSPRGARISGLDARMALEEISNDNGGEVIAYEITGGEIPSFTEFPAQAIFPFTLDRRDFSHELCIRGKDLAGNVSTPDCVVIEQRSSILLAAEGSEEENPAIFGDLVVYTDRTTGVTATNLRTGARAVIDASRGFAVARLDGNETTGVLVYENKLREFDTQNAVSSLSGACVRECADNLDNHFATDVSGGDVVINGELGGVQGVFHTTVAGCLDPFSGAGCGPLGGSPDPGVRLTDVARNVQFCGGNRDTGPRIQNRVITWCEDNGGSVEIHRFDLDDPGDDTVAVDVDLANDLHQPVVSDTHVYWASGADLCRIPHGEAGAGLTGCPPTHRILSDQVAALDAVDGDRVAFVIGTGDGIGVPRDVTIFDAVTSTSTQLTDDLLDQEAISLFRDRVVYSDRQRFSQDIVLRELTEGTWAAVDPSLQAKADTNGKHIVWLDLRNGTVQMFAQDTETGVEFEVTSAAEQVTPSDSIFGLGINASGQHLVAYGVTDLGTGVRTVFIQDLETGIRSEIPPGERGNLEAVNLNREGTRMAWFNVDLGRIRTAAVTGTTIGAVTSIGKVGANDVDHVAIAQDTIVYIDSDGGGLEEVRCADTAGNDHLIDTEGRDIALANVPALGTFVAAWGGANLKACELTCGATATCSVETIAQDFGGETVGPSIDASGLMTFQSQTPNDGFGNIGMFDFVTRERFKIASDFGVDGPAPVFDPNISGNRVVWSGFAFGSSDIFTAVLSD